MGGRPLLVASAAFAAGAYYGIAADARAAAGCALALGAAGALLLGAARISGERWRAAAWTVSVAGLACALGVARGAVAARPAQDSALFSWLDAPAAAVGGREAILLEGEVLEATLARGGSRLLVRIDKREASPGAPLLRAPAGVRALVLGPRSVHHGDHFRGFARLRRPQHALNPGSRDARKELALRAVPLMGTLEGEGLEIARRGPWLFRALDELRDRFTRRCADLCTTPRRAALVAALGVGDRSLLDEQLDEELSETGLVHLLSSAGLHVAAIALGVRAASRKILGHSGLALRAHSISSALSIPPALAEIFLLGAPWPAARAGLGAAVALLAPCAQRRSDGLTALGVGGACCVAADPAAAHDLALQLSAIGVFGLVAVAPRFRELLPPAGRRRGLLARAGESTLQLACATTAATLCTAPLLATTFHRISLVAVPANILGLAPGVAAVPLATVAALLGGISPALALPFLWASDLLAGAVLLAADAFAALPAGTLWLAAPGALAILSWTALIAALAASPRRFRAGRRILLAACPLFLLCCLVAKKALVRRLSQQLEIVFLSVGQGDCALVIFPGGRTLLVDAGGDLRGMPPPLGPGLRDPGRRDVLPALAELGIARIDWAVLTHPHPDHGGGIPAILRGVEVGELWLTGEPGGSRIGEQIAQLARAHGVRVRLAPAETQPLEVGGARVEVLHPLPRFDPARGENDNSIVLRLVHGRATALLAGDIEALAEAQLAQGPSDLQADLLKVPHHGSRTSSTEAFLRRVRPRTVVLSVGEQNRFGFPHPEVLERLRAAGATQLFRTDQGAITAVSDGTSFRLEQHRPP